MNLRANLNQQITERLDLTVRGNYVRSHADFITEGEQTNGVLTSIVFTPTIYDPSIDEAD